MLYRYCTISVDLSHLLMFLTADNISKCWSHICACGTTGLLPRYAGIVVFAVEAGEQ